MILKINLTKYIFLIITTILCLTVNSQVDTICKNVSFEIEEEVVNISCFGKNDGRIILNPKGGKEPYDYTINGKISGNNGIFDELGAGNYQVVITDAQGCEEVLDYMLSEPTYYEIDLGPDMQTFSDMEIALDAGDDYRSYQWSTGDNQRYIVFKREVTEMTTEKISLIAIDKNGCEIPSTILSITIIPREENTKMNDNPDSI